MSRTLLTLLLSSVAFAPLPAMAQDPAPPTVEKQLKDWRAADVEIISHILEPKQVKPTPDHLAKIKLPDGFSISVFAENLTNPRMIAVSGDGTVYVTERATGALVMLKESDADGKADIQQVVANRPALHGIAIDGDQMVLATVNDLYRTTLGADGKPGELTRIVDDLPDSGQHPNRTVAFGPDGKLYVSAGSTCNACAESSPESATMLKVEPDGSGRSIFATGLRNTIGFAFTPDGMLWGMDHGIDELGDEVQPEELNRIEEGKAYGWPYVYADGQFNPQDDPPNGLTMEEWAARSTDPVLLYTPHAAPMQMALYEGSSFPAEYRGDAFVAMRGSWNRKPPSGYEVVRIHFENGTPVSIKPFVTGFLMQTEDAGWSQMGRLAGLAVAGDGSLLLSDDTNGVIYRIAYDAKAGGAAATNAAPSPAPAAAPATPDHGPVDLAGAALAAKGGPIDVVSAAFNADTRIPDRFAAEGENISPPLDWADGPEGTKSYAILMEDPDAAMPKPFLHWSAWNLPADDTALPEGVPPAPKLAAPDSVKQGRNDSGATGYFGPRPPVGDPDHHYHFQVFALDAMLDLPHGAGRADILKAMEGHVLSMGEIVGTYSR